MNKRRLAETLCDMSSLADIQQAACVIGAAAVVDEYII
jgi:hypothetical protein